MMPFGWPSWAKTPLTSSPDEWNACDSVTVKPGSWIEPPVFIGSIFSTPCPFSQFTTSKLETTVAPVSLAICTVSPTWSA